METIKTWQERCTDGQHNFASFNEARDAEIADLRAALAKQAESAGVGADERAAFEAWCKNRGNAAVRLKGTDQYVVPDVQAAWSAWKGCADVAHHTRRGSVQASNPPEFPKFPAQMADGMALDDLWAYACLTGWRTGNFSQPNSESDAARYRFLCDNAYRMSFDLSESQESIDAAIDAAMAAQQVEKGGS